MNNERFKNHYQHSVQMFVNNNNNPTTIPQQQQQQLYQNYNSDFPLLAPTNQNLSNSTSALFPFVNNKNNIQNNNNPSITIMPANFHQQYQQFHYASSNAIFQLPHTYSECFTAPHLVHNSNNAFILRNHLSQHNLQMPSNMYNTPMQSPVQHRF